jgi:hypothetical protein
MLGQETVSAINANSAAHLLRPRDPPVGSLVVKELQRDMLAHAEQQRLAGAGTLRCAGRCDGRSAVGQQIANRNTERRVNARLSRILRAAGRTAVCPVSDKSACRTGADLRGA